MWVLLALFSAMFSGTAWILAKAAGENDPRVSVALRSGALLVCSIVFIGFFGSFPEFTTVDKYAIWYALGAGATSALGLVCYQSLIGCGLGWGSSMEKLSILLISLIEWIWLGVRLSFLGVLALGLIGLGSLRTATSNTTGIDKSIQKSRLLGVIGMIGFTSASTILAKFAVGGSTPEMALFIRTGVQLAVLVLWLMVDRRLLSIRQITWKSRWILISSGVCSAIAWLCYFRALVFGSAGAIHALDKLNVIVTVFAGWLLFDERYSRRMLSGVMITVIGILSLAFSYAKP